MSKQENQARAATQQACERPVHDDEDLEEQGGIGLSESARGEEHSCEDAVDEEQELDQSVDHSANKGIDDSLLADFPFGFFEAQSGQLGNSEVEKDLVQ